MNGQAKVCPFYKKIQIWVQQDGTEYWQNGSFSITNVCQSSSIDTTTSPSLAITESGYTDVTANSFSAYCKISGTKSIARVEYSAWNIAASTETTVTKEGSISDGYSKIPNVTSPSRNLVEEQARMVFV